MYLLEFETEEDARDTLGDRFDLGIPTALVTKDAVYDEEGKPVSPREVVDGYWLWFPTDAQILGGAAYFDQDGLRTTDAAIIGARPDPVVAGMPSLTIEFATSAEPQAEGPTPAPDRPTLSDWRVALIQMGRFADVKAAVEAARDTGSVDGLIAWERFEYANNVYRAELLRLAPVFGFSEADIDQSLRIAATVSNDLASTP